MKNIIMNKKGILSILLAVLLAAIWTPVAPEALAAGTEAEEDVSITISAAGDCTFGSDRSSPSSVNFYAVYNIGAFDKIWAANNSIFIIKFLKNIHMKLSKLHIGFIHSINE